MRAGEGTVAHVCVSGRLVILKGGVVQQTSQGVVTDVMGIKRRGMIKVYKVLRLHCPNTVIDPPGIRP